ncbi:MAG: hypothetical protein PHH54_05285 [Candidatus Nanoarchaeia archaeon]|nr:hypothetical protein [Candidatus Nanoarchaeia archaeon]MDD5741371.1 hypothetical protein [Candidatus Nanoarchaeia archaeon]
MSKSTIQIICTGQYPSSSYWIIQYHRGSRYSLKYSINVAPESPIDKKYLIQQRDINNLILNSKSKYRPHDPKIIGIVNKKDLESKLLEHTVKIAKNLAKQKQAEFIEPNFS